MKKEKIQELKEELKIIDEINLLSLDELKEKYLKQSYFDNFLDLYSRVFSNRLMYQLRVADEHAKIMEFFKEGVTKYPSEDNNKKVKILFDAIERIRSGYSVKETSIQNDKYKALSLFNYSLGADRVPYHNLVTSVYNSLCEYEKLHESETPLDTFSSDIYPLIKHGMERFEIESEIEKYIQEHPLSSKRNDIEFLYFINYMLSYQKGDVDDEFLSNAKGLLEMSDIFDSIGRSDRENSKEYRKVAAFTKKHIKRFENEEKKEQLVGSKKIKQYFNQKRNK